LLLEPYGDLVDGLAATMSADEAETFAIDGAMPIQTAIELLVRNYGWALAGDYERNGASARFWYVSSEKLEPRLGERDREPGAEQELPLDIGRAARALATAFTTYHCSDLSLAHFLSDHPEHRLMVRRVQLSANHPYGEIRDNLMPTTCVRSICSAANYRFSAPAILIRNRTAGHASPCSSMRPSRMSSLFSIPMTGFIRCSRTRPHVVLAE
jgi:hypothetical protein